MGGSYFLVPLEQLKPSPQAMATSSPLILAVGWPGEVFSGVFLSSWLCERIRRKLGGGGSLEKQREEEWLAGDEPKRMVGLRGGSSRMLKGVIW